MSNFLPTILQQRDLRSEGERSMSPAAVCIVGFFPLKSLSVGQHKLKELLMYSFVSLSCGTTNKDCIKPSARFLTCQ